MYKKRYKSAKKDKILASLFNNLGMKISCKNSKR